MKSNKFYLFYTVIYNENMNTKTINLIGPLPLNPTNINYDYESIIIDGGLNHNLKFQKQISIGDNDSSQSNLDILLNKEKDYSDFSKALEYIEPSAEQIICYGLLGGRLDHQLAIIGDTCAYLKKKYGIFHFHDESKKKLSIFSSGKWEFNTCGEFSVLTINRQIIKITGAVKYQIQEYTYLNPLSSHGISNIADGLFYIQCEKPAIILFNS